MCIFKLFKKHGTGALLDPRSEEQKKKDYLFNEMVSSPEPVNWTEKKEWRNFPIFDQDNSSSCVAFSLAKIMGIQHQVNEGEWVDFSPGFIYQHRKNKPSKGMAGVDAWEIARKEGLLLETFFPSQNKNDKYLDDYKIKDYEREVAKVFKVGNYVTIPSRDIDTVASIIQKTGKAVMVWFYFGSGEWDKTVPIIKQYDLNLYDSGTSKHSVAAVDFTIHDGKKCLIIEDSWGKVGIKGQRIITEDFFKERNFFCAYPINFKFNGSQELPEYEFKKDMEYGEQSDEVAKLQDRLKILTFFPSNVESTGNYYGITRQAVKDFQFEYEVASQEELEAVNGMRVGSKTRAKLNEIFKGQNN